MISELLGLLVSVSVLSMPPMAHAEGRYPKRIGGPVLLLERATGDIAELGQSNKCEIYSNHEQLRGKNISKLIAEARTAPEGVLDLHKRATYPRVLYSAYLLVPGQPKPGGGGSSAEHFEKFVFKTDASDIRGKTGEAAEMLSDLIVDICIGKR